MATLVQYGCHFGTALNNGEVASILRNWTVGETGTLSASGKVFSFGQNYPKVKEFT